MIDAALLPLQRRILNPAAKLLHARGVLPDQITIAGFCIGLLTLPALAFEFYGLALCFLLLNRLADGLDGAVARLGTPTDRGAFLDIAVDFVFYGLFPLGFALANPEQNALAAAFLVASFIGTGSSFLAFSIMAERRGIGADGYPTKGIYYLGGLTEGAETIGFFIAFCLWPAAFPWLACIFAVAAFITTAIRWRMGWEAFSED